MAWRDVAFHAFSKRWRVGGSKVIIEVPLVALATRMMRWDVGGRRSHPLVSFYTSRWAATTGRSASVVCSLVCRISQDARETHVVLWGLLGWHGRLMSVQIRNQTRALFSAQRESGATVTRGKLTDKAYRKAKTLSQLYVMVANVSVVACFVLPIFIFFSSSASTLTLL